MLSTPITVRWGDMDSYGHVNNVFFIRQVNFQFPEVPIPTTRPSTAPSTAPSTHPATKPVQKPK